MKRLGNGAVAFMKRDMKSNFGEVLERNLNMKRFEKGDASRRRKTCIRL